MPKNLPIIAALLALSGILAVAACAIADTPKPIEIQLTQRAEMNTPIDVLRSATSANAKTVQMEGQFGCVRPGAHADLLVLNGDPLKDLDLFREPLTHIPLVMKGEVCVLNLL
jgi:imidazolonepropionase-like amidohydrolase